MASTPYRRNFANMPTFADEGIYPHLQNNPDSHALQALQSYGSSAKNAPAEPAAFENLNLNSVEEEDEFLYGDSNSVPDEPIRRTNVQDETVVSKTESGWSDEEDFYAGSSAMKKEPSSNNPYVWNAPGKVHSVKSPQKTAFSGRSMGFNNPAVSGNSSQRSVTTVKGDFHVSVKNSRPVSPPARVEPKSKYHAAAELLKKKALEKNKTAGERSYSNSSEKSDQDNSVPPVPGVDPPPKRTVVLPKSSKPLIDRKSLNIVNAHIGREIKRPAAKHFFEPEIIEVKNPEVSKKPMKIEDLAQDPKFIESFKSASLLHHHPDNRESSQKQSPYYESGLTSRERPHSRGSSRSPPSRYSRRQSRSPSYESHSRKRSHSPYEHRHRSRSPYKSRDRSPYGYSRHKLSKSRSRSPYDRSRGRHSRSPPNKFRERSPRYYRSRSRSRSPKPHGSKSRPVEAIKQKLAKKVGNNSKSFSSIDRGHSNSPVLSDSYGRDKMKEKAKSSEKSENFVKADKPLNPSVSKPNVSPSSNEQAILDELIDAQKNLSEEEKTFLALFSQIEPVNLLAELVKNSQSPNVEEPLPAVTEPPLSEPPFNMYGMPPEVPQVPYPQPFPFNPSIPPPTLLAPVSVPPPIPIETYPFQQMMSQPPPTVYPPTIEVHQPKKSPFRPTTLRSIPTSDEVTCPPSDSKKAPDPRSKAKKDPSSGTDVETASARKSGQKADLKPDEPLTAAQVRSLENQASVMESYKKLKAERHYAHTKVNKAVSDIIEMRQLIDETWCKKGVTPAEKLIYEKCKTVLSSATETMNKNIKDAKHFDDELNRLKKKMTPEMLNEASNFKLQDCIKDEEPVINSNYILFDPGKHACYSCNKQYDKVHDMLIHLLNPEHQEKIDPSEKDWAQEFKTKPVLEEGKIKSGTLHPIQGVEFMKPNVGYFCTLCKAYCLDVDDAEQHLKGNDHTNKYKTYIKENPLYDSKCLVKRLIKYSMNSKLKAKKQNDAVESKSHKRKESSKADNEKAKKVAKIEPHKEFKVEELEEEESISIEPKVPKVEGIKLTLSKEKEKAKPKEEKKPVKDPKAAQRVVYIGKAPNFKNRSKPWYKQETFSDGKKNAEGSLCGDMMEKLKERLSINKERAQSPLSNRQSSSSRTNSAENLGGSQKSTKSSEQGESSIQSKEAENCKASNKIEKTNDQNSRLKGSDHLSKVNDKKNDPRSKNYSKSAESASSKSDKKGRDASPVTVSKSVSDKNKSLKAKNAGKDHEIKTDNPVVNQAIKNILYGPDPSSCPSVSLSEITLPEAPNSKSLSPSKNRKNEAVPMDISPERVETYRPRTEQENEYFMLGINKDDMKPLAVPVPPPVINYFPEAPSVPPMHIISSVPPPGYERTVPSGTFIPTNIPPPGYPNCPMTPCGVPPVVQGSPPFIPTNMPPPGYNVNVGTSHFTSPTKTLLSTPQSAPNAAASKPKAKNTNLITIPTTAAANKKTNFPQASPLQKPAAENKKTNSRQPSKSDAPKQVSLPSESVSQKVSLKMALISKSPQKDKGDPIDKKKNVAKDSPQEDKSDTIGKKENDSNDSPHKDKGDTFGKKENATKDSPQEDKSDTIGKKENATKDSFHKDKGDTIGKQENATKDSPREDKGDTIGKIENATKDSPREDKGDTIGKKENAAKDSPQEDKSDTIDKKENDSKDSPHKDKGDTIGKKENSTEDSPNVKSELKLQDESKSSAVSDIKKGIGQDTKNTIGSKTLQKTLECSEVSTDVSLLTNADSSKMETEPSEVCDIKKFKEGIKNKPVSADNTSAAGSNLERKPDAESKQSVDKDLEKEKKGTPIPVGGSSSKEILSDVYGIESEAEDSTKAAAVENNTSVKNTQESSGDLLSDSASKSENFEVGPGVGNHNGENLSESTSEAIRSDVEMLELKENMAAEDSATKESAFDELQVMSKEGSMKAGKGVNLEGKRSLMPSSPEDSSKATEITNSSEIVETQKIVSMDVDIKEEATVVAEQQNNSLPNLSEGKQTESKISVDNHCIEEAENTKQEEKRVDDQTVIDSQKQCSDTAESVFNYEAFEKLEALTQDSVDDSESKFKKIESTDFLAPPILSEENSENSMMPEIKDEHVPTESCDQTQCLPPVLELEICKKQENASAPVLTSHLLIRRECSEEEKKEADLCSSSETKIKSEAKESEKSQDSEDVKEKRIVFHLEQQPDIEGEEPIKMEEKANSPMELLNESEDAKEIITEEEIVNISTEQKADDAYDSDTETDEYENEDV